MKKSAGIVSAEIVIGIPTSFYGRDRDDRSILSDLEDTLRQVKRHVDTIVPPEVRKEYAMVCSFCGSPWTKDGDQYNGGCCDEDVENAPKAGL